MLPKLVVNGMFMRDFITAGTPCCALGIIEDRKLQCGLVALRLNDVIPNEILDRGLGFGHQLLGIDDNDVVYLGFEFYGFKTYNVIINPNSPVSQAVLNMMIETGDYFILVINPDNSVTAFCSEIGGDTLIWLKTYILRIKESNTTAKEYEKTLSSFERNPLHLGELINWICRYDTRYIDINSNRLELNPVR
jgi:hypothetical protein